MPRVVSRKERENVRLTSQLRPGSLLIEIQPSERRAEQRSKPFGFFSLLPVDASILKQRHATDADCIVHTMNSEIEMRSFFPEENPPLAIQDVATILAYVGIFDGLKK